MVKRGGNRELTLFFCGWGMDEHAVQHVTGAGDVLVFYDYRDISKEEAPMIEEYRSVRVVAWSMGVWAASVLLNRWNLPTSYRIAINGTERPVDERIWDSSENIPADRTGYDRTRKGQVFHPYVDKERGG